MSRKNTFVFIMFLVIYLYQHSDNVLYYLVDHNNSFRRFFAESLNFSLSDIGFAYFFFSGVETTPQLNHTRVHAHSHTYE